MSLILNVGGAGQVKMTFRDDKDRPYKNALVSGVSTGVKNWDCTSHPPQTFEECFEKDTTRIKLIKCGRSCWILLGPCSFVVGGILAWQVSLAYNWQASKTPSN